MDYFLQQVINGVSLGSIYALVAIGLAMVFGILRLINFAHGDLLMLGAYAFFFLVASGSPWWAALTASVLVSAVAGVLMERIAYRPLRGQDDVTMLITSFAVSTFLQNGATLEFGANARAFNSPDILNGVISFGGFQIARVDAVGIVISLALMVLLTYFVNRTSAGTAMRAASQDLMAARLVGININRVIMVAFAVGSALAAVAGFLWASKVGKINPLMGFDPLLKAFTAAIIGGFGSLPGAVLGSYVLALAEVFFQGYLPPAMTGYRDAFVFGMLIVFLLVRPQGLLGTAGGEKI